MAHFGPRALGSIRSVCMCPEEEQPCYLQHGSMRSMEKWQRRREAGTDRGKMMWLESGQG